MKSSLLTLLFAFVVSFFAGCSDEESSSNPTVSVLCAPLAEVVRNVAGDRLEVVAVVPSHADLHTFEPTPRDMGQLFNSELFLAMDVPMEERFVKVLHDNSVAVVNIADDVERLPISCHHDHEHEHEHEDVDHHEHEHDHDHEVTSANGDPHIWLSLPNCIIMAQESCKALCDKYPEYSEEFKNNTNRYVLELTTTHNELKAMFANYAGKRFYIFHPSLGYFSHDYNLEQKALEVDGKTPTIKQLEAVMNLAKQDGVNVILASEQFNTELPQRAADLLKIKLEYLNPMAQDVPSELKNISTIICNDWAGNSVSVK